MKKFFVLGLFAVIMLFFQVGPVNGGDAWIYTQDNWGGGSVNAYIDAPTFNLYVYGYVAWDGLAYAAVKWTNNNGVFKNRAILFSGPGSQQLNETRNGYVTVTLQAYTEVYIVNGHYGGPVFAQAQVTW
jgi:hypothetical protein